jgi:hypothetical protein
LQKPLAQKSCQVAFLPVGYDKNQTRRLVPYKELEALDEHASPYAPNFTADYYPARPAALEDVWLHKLFSEWDYRKQGGTKSALCIVTQF